MVAKEEQPKAENVRVLPSARKGACRTPVAMRQRGTAPARLRAVPMGNSFPAAHPPLADHNQEAPPTPERPRRLQRRGSSWITAGRSPAGVRRTLARVPPSRETHLCSVVVHRSAPMLTPIRPLACRRRSCRQGARAAVRSAAHKAGGAKGFQGTTAKEGVIPKVPRSKAPATAPKKKKSAGDVRGTTALPLFFFFFFFFFFCFRGPCRMLPRRSILSRPLSHAFASSLSSSPAPTRRPADRHHRPPHTGCAQGRARRQT